jgi:anthranilate synthase/aminodeoxychorismate synthase-like glutamine amidotransferase
MSRIPVLGVCLGHQAIVEVFGGAVVRAPRLMHGKASSVRHDGRGLFESMPESFAAGRYHSLIAERARLPEALAVTAWTEEGEIMGVRHQGLAVEGVQFHPESVLTPEGPRLLAAFLRDRSPRMNKPGREALDALLERRDLTEEAAYELMCR